MGSDPYGYFIFLFFPRQGLRPWFAFFDRQDSM